MGKLMLIAVDVDTGTVPDPQPPSPPLPNFPKVIGIIDSSDFEVWETNLFSSGKAQRVRRASSPGDPYHGPNPPTKVAEILHTHNSPGCTWVIINGWPFCYS